MLKINNIDVSTFGVSVLFDSEEAFTPEIRTSFTSGKVGSANASISHGNAVHSFKCSIEGDIRNNLENVKLLFLDENGEYKKEVKVEWDKWNGRYYNCLLSEAITLSLKSDRYGEFDLTLVSIDPFALSTIEGGKYVESADLAIQSENIPVNYQGSSKTGFSIDFNGLVGELVVQAVDDDNNKKTFKYRENALTDTLNPSSVSGVAFSQPWQEYVNARASLLARVTENSNQDYKDGADFEGKNLAKKTTTTENRLLQETGFLVNSSTSFVTDYFKVEYGEQLTFQKPANATYSRIGYYDANKTFLSLASWTQNTFTTTVPEYVHYIRWCPDATSGKFNEGYMVSKGTEAYNIVPSVEDIAVEVVKRASDNILDIDDKSKISQYISVINSDYSAISLLSENYDTTHINLDTAYVKWQSVVTTQSISTFLQIDFNEFTITENGSNTMQFATGDFLTINKNTKRIILSGNMEGSFNVSWNERFV